MRAITPRTANEITAGTWTISARIHDALSAAEACFGPRDASFNFLGFEYKADLSSPRTAVNPKDHTVEIWLPSYCENDHDQAVYQLSHEVVHVLAPSGYLRPTNIEEGLATLFSEKYTQAAVNKLAAVAAENQSYKTARDAVEAFLTDSKLVRDARTVEPAFYLMTPNLLMFVNKACTKAQADYLCGTFQAKGGFVA